MCKSSVARMGVVFAQDDKKGKTKVKTRTGDGLREQRLFCLTRGAIAARQFFCGAGCAEPALSSWHIHECLQAKQ